LDFSGKTIGVLASGLDMNSLKKHPNFSLIQKILKREGSLISEYPLNTPSLKHHFPARNRILAGLAKGTLVIEAPLKSGALITAHYALEEGRVVMAVPGSIFRSTSQGTINLLKQGAQLIVSSQDVLDALNLEVIISSPSSLSFSPQSKEEEIIYQSLSSSPQNIDEIIRKTNLKTNQVLAIITFLELKGIIKKTGPNQYVKI
jgi:DNA processing protein